MKRGARLLDVDYQHREKLILELREIHELTYPAIAQRLGISEKTARKIYSAARIKRKTEAARVKE